MLAIFAHPSKTEKLAHSMKKLRPIPAFQMSAGQAST